MNRKVVLLSLMWIGVVIICILMMALLFSMLSYQIVSLLVIMSTVTTFIVYYADFNSFTTMNYPFIFVGYNLVFCTIYYYSVDLGYSFHLRNTKSQQQVNIYVYIIHLDCYSCRQLLLVLVNHILEYSNIKQSNFLNQLPFPIQWILKLLEETQVINLDDLDQTIYSESYGYYFSYGLYLCLQN